jgi:lipid II:glycine glycyltransferase (peptidoglycan interpeptide bridge formation enzyme)
MTFSINTVKWMTYNDLEDIPDGLTSFLIDSRHGSTLQHPKWYLYTQRKTERFFVIAAFDCDRPIFGALVQKSLIPGTPFFAASIERGPVFDDVRLAIALWADFEDRLNRECLCSLQIHPFWERDQAEQLQLFLENRGYVQSLNSLSHVETVTLDLCPSEEEIYNSMKGSRRNMIRKAEKLGVQVDIVKTQSEMKLFWKMYRDMCKAKGLNFWSMETFARVLLFSLDHPGDCVCLIGKLDGEIIGGHIALRHADVVEVTRGGASINPNKGVPKTDLILWESIRWAKRQGARIYDFGGITPGAQQGSPEWGINRFKYDFTSHRVQLFEPMEKVFKSNINNVHGSLKKVKKVVLKYLPELSKMGA